MIYKPNDLEFLYSQRLISRTLKDQILHIFATYNQKQFFRFLTFVKHIFKNLMEYGKVKVRGWG